MRGQYIAERAKQVKLLAIIVLLVQENLLHVFKLMFEHSGKVHKDSGYIYTIVITS